MKFDTKFSVYDERNAWITRDGASMAHISNHKLHRQNVERPQPKMFWIAYWERISLNAMGTWILMFVCEFVSFCILIFCDEKFEYHKTADAHIHGTQIHTRRFLWGSYFSASRILVFIIHSFFFEFVIFLFACWKNMSCNF